MRENSHETIIHCNIFLSFLYSTGIINSEGQLWKEQRRFLHEKLRHFGMTVLGNKKHLMESRIMVSVLGLRFLYSVDSLAINAMGWICKIFSILN